MHLHCRFYPCMYPGMIMFFRLQRKKRKKVNNQCMCGNSFGNYGEAIIMVGRSKS